MKKIFLIIFLLSICTSSFAANQKNYSLFGGVGELFVPASVRIGIGNWEFGLLNKSSFGITKNFYLDNKYISLGPTLINERARWSLGFFGAVGVDFQFFNWLYFKTELNAARSFTNYGFGSALIGLGVYW